MHRVRFGAVLAVLLSVALAGCGAASEPPGGSHARSSVAVLTPTLDGLRGWLRPGSGALDDFARQAELAARSLRARRGLVLIRVGADVMCPVTPFERDSLRAGLATLAAAAPGSRWVLAPRFTAATGPAGRCAYLDRAGRLVPSEPVPVADALRGYERLLRHNCARFAQCTYVR